MSLSTHVLDITTGLPAPELAVVVERCHGDAWQHLARACTDADGRVRELYAPQAGVHRLRFDTGRYFVDRGVHTFYPEIVVTFQVVNKGAHHHVPLLLGPFGYSTYRGS
ncbi:MULTISPECIES: hydroxyisourate hydrolase [unclassified Micromonospora]|uniref:hydroxyisourate hydrolase n=1 Tax=unclassified Micromonospora TaxID=2617518 RepID=UPI00248C9983|nr:MULTISPECIES: hydroxyisourate hydrolase [unclassified Micromonospora]WBC16777.1 hydroxyisourate hydrolase [Micromonospora sp. WMMA1998]WFE66790.1 hydroxyisourate hydrolase [Micromonospora sp. WMMD714]